MILHSAAALNRFGLCKSGELLGAADVDCLRCEDDKKGREHRGSDLAAVRAVAH